MKRVYFQMTAVFLTAMFLFSSCASIVSKSTYPLSINTSPSNAQVSITDQKGTEVFKGSTPATVNLKAGAGFFVKSEYQVKLSSPGYDEKVIPVTFAIDGWYFGNIFLGGILGMLIIDPATGAMWKMETNAINETLAPSSMSVNPELKLIDINEIPENLRSNLVRVN